MSALLTDFNSNIIKHPQYSHLPASRKEKETKCIKSYKHLTFKVQSVAEYLEVIKLITVSNKECHTDLAFRGMGNHLWQLLPSLTRDEYEYAHTENYMVKELLTLRPEEFNGIDSSFDLLAKMQHFGLPTRLLDFTTNPLVALYFACHEKELQKLTGRVVCTHYDSMGSCYDTPNIICDLYKQPFYQEYGLETFVPENLSLLEYLFIICRPIIAKPKYANERIKRQSALFMIFPNSITDCHASDLFFHKKGIFPLTNDTLLKLDEIEQIESIYPIINRAIECIDARVTPNRLERIIHAYTPYGGLTIPQTQTIRTEFKSYFDDRFEITSYIKPIDKTILKSQFCSILIESKHKNTIMEELDYLNINEAFLFPELEYTTKLIKEKYYK